jgi:hypothetical protein
VITFTQGEKKGIDQAWNRFNSWLNKDQDLTSPVTYSCIQFSFPNP